MQTSSSYGLRNLPLPVKLVASVFLLAVGLGYGSAMVQLHMQDSKSGKPMPTPDDVIKKYTGKVRAENAKAPRSKFVEVIQGDPEGTFNNRNMAPAFFREDVAPGNLRWKNAIQGKSPEEVNTISAQRNGERDALTRWAALPEPEREQAYEDDEFRMGADRPPAITPFFLKSGAVKVKTLINTRCAVCHYPDGRGKNWPLQSYDDVKKYLEIPPRGEGAFVRETDPISIDTLTQTTHTHLLSFAMLFSLTGVIFAFSSYPTWVRCVVGPWVVVALVADISLWWAARLSDQWGPYFAMGIIGTGAAAGLGLTLQITLGLLNMYGPKGKTVVAFLFLLGGAGATALYVAKIGPGLDEKNRPKVAEDPKPVVPPGNDGKGAEETITNAGSAVAGAVQAGPGTPEVPPYGGKPTSDLDRLVAWPPVDTNGNPVAAPGFTLDGSMTPAFFEKDKDYKKIMDQAGVPQAEKDKLKAHREGEAAIFQAWTRTPEAARKKAYDDDAFPIPKGLDKAITPEFVKDGKVQIKALFGARCLVCHGPGGKQHESYPLDSYDLLKAYMEPYDTAAPLPVDDGSVRATEPPTPAPLPNPKRRPVVLPVLAVLATNDD